MPGAKGDLIVTGQLGDVMKGVTAALSYVRSHAKELKISPDFYEKSEIPSTSAISVLETARAPASPCSPRSLPCSWSPREVPPRDDGQVTLSGQVLPVGGIKGKGVAPPRRRQTSSAAAEREDYLEDVPGDPREAQGPL